MATGDAAWYGADGTVDRTRGRLFELACLGATSVGIVAVFGLLVYVTVLATRPLSADPGWYAVFGATVVLPASALAVYFYRSDEPAGEVAYTVTGLPLVGLLVAGGLLVVFAELLSVAQWFALAIALAASAGAVYAHGRLRPEAPLERLFVTVAAPAVALFGVPPTWIALQVGLSRRIVSLRELVLKLPYLPLPWLQLAAALTVPVAVLGGLFVARRWESTVAGRNAALLLAAGAVVGPLLGPPLGLAATTPIVVYTAAVVPVALYVAEVYRRREGLGGLLFPVALVAGAILGYAVTSTLGLAGPDTWLDWSFLTSAPNRTPSEAGIYPALVGSVMLLLVVVLSTFPVGVGAAIYLEEYAPSDGPVGKLVTLIEINIANLAGVPSVVYGLLALAVFIRYVQLPSGSVIVGGLAVGLLILPIVIISAQEAIQAVPDSMRRASYGMGATRWQTTRNVVLPEAMPGIMTGTILALGRAIGETAPLLMIGLAASVRLAPNGFFDKGSAMPRQIYSWAFEIDPQFWYGVLAAGVVTLLVVLLVMNGTAILIRNKYQRRT